MAHHKPNLPEKPCVYCAKPMLWRKAWAKTWDSVMYCSNACQRHANRARRQAGEAVGVAPEPRRNAFGARVWTKEKPGK
jgi:hypothetical protein